MKETTLHIVLLMSINFYHIFSISPECEVTEWKAWQECSGDCRFALRVRNRDVLEPPFPEARADGLLVIEPCPALFQVQQCFLESCPQPQTILNITNGTPDDERLTTTGSTDFAIISDLFNIGNISDLQSPFNKDFDVQSGKNEISRSDLKNFSTSPPNLRIVDFEVPLSLSPFESNSKLGRSEKPLDVQSFSIDEPSAETAKIIKIPFVEQSQVINVKGLTLIPDEPAVNATNLESIVSSRQPESSVQSDNFLTTKPPNDSYDSFSTTISQQITSSLSDSRILADKFNASEFLKQSKFPLPDDFRLLLAKMALISLPVVPQIQVNLNQSLDKNNTIISIDDSLDDYSTIIVDNSILDSKFKLSVLKSPELLDQKKMVLVEPKPNDNETQTVNEPTLEFGRSTEFSNLSSTIPSINVTKIEQSDFTNRSPESNITLPIITNGLQENEALIIKINPDTGKNTPDQEETIGSKLSPKHLIQKMFENRKTQLELQLKEVEQQKLELINQLSVGSVASDVQRPISGNTNCNKTASITLGSLVLDETATSKSVDQETTTQPLTFTTDVVGTVCGNSYNRRCCKQPHKLTCPNGRAIQMVTRWFRLENHTVCTSYNYAYCGYDVEIVEKPIKFQEECLELCYSPFERRENLSISVFRNLRFENDTISARRLFLNN